jgi:hypothetical protein
MSSSSSPRATNLSLDAMFVVCWIKGSYYNWKHVRISFGFPRERWTLLWDLTISGWPNEWINITWQCFIKSDSRYLYEYIILHNAVGRGYNTNNCQNWTRFNCKYKFPPSVNNENGSIDCFSDIKFVTDFPSFIEDLVYMLPNKKWFIWAGNLRED